MGPDLAQRCATFALLGCRAISTVVACALCLAAVGCDGSRTSDDARVDADGGETDSTSDSQADDAEQRSCREPGTPGCGLVEIPGGTFDMGEEPSTGAAEAAPLQPSITVGRFAIDRFEVTKGRFRAFWNAGHPAPPGPVPYPSGRDLPFTGTIMEPAPTSADRVRDAQLARDCSWRNARGDDHPINCISWATAQAFCVWDGGRLPTAAEWEFAARGTDGRPYPWGSEAPNDALACQAMPATLDMDGTCPVGSRPAGDSPFGVHDMAGNVREWNADWYMPYADRGCWGAVPRTNPLCGDATMNARLSVGGSWVNHLEPRWMHSATRYWGVAAYPPGEGFRCARTRP